MARELTIKIRADGTQAKQELRETETAIGGVTKSTAEAEKAMTTMGTNSSKAIAAIGGALAAAQIGEKLHAAVESASHIEDISQKLGISAEAVQKFGFAASQAGSSIDAVGTAIVRMGANITQSTGKDGVAKAIADLGLSLDDIKKLKPEDAFLAITDAIKQVPDPMRQSADAMAIFGRGGAELLPAIKAGFKEVGDQAPLMSNAVVAAGDNVGDNWDKIKDKSNNLIAGALLPVADWFIKTMPEGVQVGVGAILGFLPSLEQLALGLLAVGGPSGAMAALSATGAAIVTFFTATLPGAITGFVTGAGAFLVTFFTTTLPAAFGAIITFLGPQGLIAIAVVALGLVWYKWGDDIKRIVADVYTAIKTWLVDKFADVVKWIGQKVDDITGFFANMYDKVVGHSYVPDMVDRIGEEFGRLPTVMVEPTAKSSSDVLSIFGGLSTAVPAGLSAAFDSGRKVVSGILRGMTGDISGWVSAAMSAISLVRSAWDAVSGLFQSEETKKVNKPRDSFFAQFGGQDGLASSLTSTLIGQGVTEAGAAADTLIKTLFAADTENKFHDAEDAIIAIFAASGKQVQKFAQGTLGRYQDFGAGTPAILHGKERVMTEAEGRAEADGWRMLAGTFERKFNQLQESVRRTQEVMLLQLRAEQLKQVK